MHVSKWIMVIKMAFAINLDAETTMPIVVGAIACQQMIIYKGSCCKCCALT
jgi:hypothetical protein